MEELILGFLDAFITVKYQFPGSDDPVAPSRFYDSLRTFLPTICHAATFDIVFPTKRGLMRKRRSGDQNRHHEESVRFSSHLQAVYKRRDEFQDFFECQNARDFVRVT